ncbi:IS66 family insertion sequence element accessory protein TnpB, partial [Ileibacterium valens]
LFLFCGRRADRIKGLLWQQDGFLLLYKRLDDGHFRWPRDKNEVRELSSQQLRWLLEGLFPEQKTTVKRR